MSDTAIHELTYDHLHGLCGCSPENLVDRLKNHYDFQCEGGPLKNCVEWQQLKRLLAAEQEKTKELAKQLARSQQLHDATCHTDAQALRQRAEAAEARLSLLGGYVQHKSDCASQGGYDHVGQDEDGNAWHIGHEPYPCTCGLDAALPPATKVT